MQNYKIALITNCIKPNTNAGPITQFSISDRIASLVENLNYLIKTTLFEEIYIIDPFIEDEIKKEKFKNLLEINGIIENKIQYLTFKPNSETKTNINSRGKGFSELNMIIESLRQIKEKHKNGIVYKISGRYKILNIKKIVEKNNLKIKNKKYYLNIPFSNLLKKCYTVIFSFRLDIDIILFVNCLRSIDDNKYKYLEHSLYENIIKKKRTNFSRERLLPTFETNLKGGSKQGRYRYHKQLINSIIYRFF